MFKLRDEATAQKIIQKIKAMNVDYKFMHVCGTHQRYGVFFRFHIRVTCKHKGMPPAKQLQY